MAIRTIEEEDIYLIEAELERLRREWIETQTYTTAPTSFETWVCAHLANNNEGTKGDQEMTNITYPTGWVPPWAGADQVPKEVGAQ